MNKRLVDGATLSQKLITLLLLFHSLYKYYTKYFLKSQIFISTLQEKI